MIWAGYVVRRGRGEVLVGKPEGKRLLGRPRGRWEDNIKTILKKSDGETRTAMIWLRIRGSNACECSNKPSGFIKRGEFLDWLITV